jgi:redox-sensitive bicupin YhaK (pirin superfamily)
LLAGDQENVTHERDSAPALGDDLLDVAPVGAELGRNGLRLLVGESRREPGLRRIRPGYDAEGGLMTEPVTVLITPRTADIGGFEVRRALPSAERRSVGPFVFWDEMGPGSFAPGSGLDVRPHPHIGLATLTYLFEGGILHRDSLGTVLEVERGGLNWMIAGRGIVHSERTGPDRRAAGHRLHGIQAWVGLPRALEEGPPSFAHYPSSALPAWDQDGVRLRLVVGTTGGHRSPVEAASPTLCLHAELEAGAVLVLDDEHPERAVYVVSGGLELGGAAVGAGTMAVLAPGGTIELRAAAATRAMVLGGAPLDGPRHLRWNFVASERAAIDAAERDWRAAIAAGFRGGRFGLPPDEHEHIPPPALPGGPPEPCAACPTT